MADRPPAAARVIETFQRYCDVRSEAGVETVWRSLPGVRLRPVTGDWVELQRPGPEGRPAIEAIVPRQSQLSRTTGARGSGGAVAANVDRVLVCIPAAPAVDLRLVLRLLALVSLSDIDADIVITKADESDDVTTDVERIAGIAPNVPLHLTSARTGLGVDALEAALDPGRTFALLGESGSGKSTLLNALVKEELQRTGEMAHRGGGRQTTTAARLVTLPNGTDVIDTAGFSDHAVVPLEALIDVFPAITALAEGCGFRNCRHDSEPNCAVLASVAAGETPAYLLDLYRGLASEAGAGPKRGRR